MDKYSNQYTVRRIYNYGAVAGVQQNAFDTTRGMRDDSPGLGSTEASMACCADSIF